MFKSLISILYLFSGIFALQAATPIKSLLFLDTTTNVNPTLIRTRHGSISFSVSSYQSGRQPQYFLLDFDSRNVTQVLKDISQACDIEMYAFSKLHYNQQAQALVYYCSNNNTLLLLDHDTLKVSSSIKIPLNTRFTESKMSSVGDSVAIVFLHQLFGNYQTNMASQMAIVDLNDKTAKHHIIFDKDLAQNEVVFGFAGSGLKNYIITYQFSYTVNVTIYELVILQDSYVLTSFYKFNWEYDWPYGDTVISEIYCLGDLIVTNTDSEILFLTATGQILSKNSSLSFSGFSYNIPTTLMPQMFKGKDEKTIYVCLQDSLRNNYIIRYIFYGSFLMSQVIANGSELQLAKGIDDLGDLILKYDVKTSFFQVWEAETLNPIYSCLSSYDTILVTNSTYRIHSFSGLSVFDLHSDFVLMNKFAGISFSQTTNLPLWYHDIKNELLYFINTTIDFKNCTILSLNLETTEISSFKNFSELNICRGRIIQIGSSPGELVIQAYDNSFLIISKTYGQVNFTSPSQYRSGFISTNFTSFTVNLLALKISMFGGWSLSSFEYNSQNQTFLLQNTHFLNNNMSFVDGKTFYNLQDNKIYSVSPQVLTIIDPQTKSVNTYPVLLNKPIPSLLFDLNNRSSVIISNDNSNTVIGRTPYLLEADQLSYFPGIAERTTEARSAGTCFYYTTDDFGSIAKLVKIYNTCQHENIDIISS